MQKLHPQSSISQAQAAKFDQLKVAEESCNSSPSQSLSPSKVFSNSDDEKNMNHNSRLNLIDSLNYIVKRAGISWPESVASIAPPWMFPSLTTLGKVAISIKADGSCLFSALAD